MAYATEADLASLISETKLAQLTTESGNMEDSLVLTAALSDASSRIDGYLAGRYTVPVTDATSLAILKAHCIVLVKWFLFLRNDIGESFNGSLGNEYKATIDWLMAIGKGTLSLPSGAAVPTVDVEVTDEEAIADSEDPVFGTDLAGGL